jgi:biopolymer transport protein ExbD
MIGRAVSCPNCSEMITIPDPASASADVVPVVDVIPIDSEDQYVAAEPLMVQPIDDDDDDYIVPALAVADEEEVEEVKLNIRPMADSEMDMTPMVDVTFLLLIFFMVTASFASEKVIQQRTSKKETSSSQVFEVTDQLTIRIDDLNTFLVLMPDQSESEASNKQDLLIALGDGRREGLLDDVENVKIEAHEESLHSALVAALDACRNEGLANFQVKVVEDFD